MKKKVLNGKKTLQNDIIDIVEKNVITKAKRTLMDIPVDKLKINFNIRGESYPKIDELAKSIENEGLLEPVIVKQNEDNTFTIICGHRRYKAFLSLIEKHGQNSEYSKIEAIVYDENLTQEQIEFIQLIENSQREDVEPLQLKVTFEKLRERGFTLKAIAEKIGKSEGYIKNISMGIKLLNENSELNKLVESHVNVTFADIQEVKPLPAKYQIDLISQKAEGKIKTSKELRQRVWQIKEQLSGENKEYRRHREEEKYTILNHSVKYKGFKVKSFHLNEEELNFNEAKRLKEQVEIVLEKLFDIMKAKKHTATKKGQIGGKRDRNK